MNATILKYIGIGLIFLSSTVIAQTQKGLNIFGGVGEQYGTGLSLSGDGNTIAIGTDTLGNHYGSVIFYHWDGVNWIQKGQEIYGDSLHHFFGKAISLSTDGNTVAIGAYWGDSGITKLFYWNGTEWIQKGSNITGDNPNDYSGQTVSLSGNGNIIAIGAPQNSDNGLHSGHVKIYNWDGSTWSQMGSNITGESAGDFSSWGLSLSSSGLTVAIGAPKNAGAGYKSGHTRLFEWNGNSWAQKGQSIDGALINDQSGHTLSLDSAGITIAIGEPKSSPNGSTSGQVRLFGWNGTSWAQKGTTITGGAANDNMGWSISISNDGNTVGTGIFGFKINGLNHGQIRLYEWNLTNWIQKGNSIDGAAFNDKFGSLVALSDNGNTLAGASIYNDDGGTSSGHTRVYNFCQVTGIAPHTACGKFTWIDGVTYTSNNDTATFSITTPTGCDSLVTLNLTITNTDISTSTNLNIITANLPGAQYQWIDCDNGNTPITGETNQTFTATAIGNYAVIVTQNGCSDTSACVNIASVGIQENLLRDISVYPNPSNGTVNIHLGQLQNVSVTLIDALGKKVWYSKNINASTYQLQLPSAIGFYILEIESSGITHHLKVLKR